MRAFSTLRNENSFLPGEMKLHANGLLLISCMSEWIMNGCISETVVIDLKKAFDTVDHAILCQKLESPTDGAVVV